VITRIGFFTASRSDRGPEAEDGGQTIRTAGRSQYGGHGRFIFLAKAGHTGVDPRSGPRSATSSGYRKSIARAAQDEWKPVLLWYITRDEFRVRDFLQNWLFLAYDAGTFRVRPEELHDYLHGVGKRGGTTEHAWSEFTLNRVGAGLLKMAVDFGLLRGSVVREFATYHLPERSFLYLLHAMREERNSPNEVVGAPDWRMFLMRPADVEHELLRLHQFRKLEDEVAGSLVQLSLPCASSREYAQGTSAVFQITSSHA
jgi:hypothetical protein